MEKINDLQKALLVIAQLTKQNKIYQGLMFAFGALMVIGFCLFIYDERGDERQIASQSALIVNLNNMYSEIKQLNQALEDSIFTTQAQRDSVWTLMNDYAERYEAAARMLDQKDEIIFSQEQKIYALKHQKRESGKMMELMAAKYEKKYNDLEKRLKVKYSYKNYDSVYQYKILEDGTKLQRVVKRSEPKVLKASYHGDYLSFVGAKSDADYMLTVYQMSSPVTKSIRQGSTLNGHVVVNVSEFFYDQDIEPPFVIELTHGDTIFWQYNAIREFPKGAIASDIQKPQTRAHVYSTGGTRDSGVDEKI